MIHILIGTRAQLIKMAPVIRDIESRGLPMNLVFTGQHRVTMTELLKDFAIRVRPRLLYEGPEVGGVLHMGRWFLLCLWRLLSRRGEWLPAGAGGAAVLVVHGDTMSTLLGALAGRCLGMTVAHVESGLRSFNWRQPFPEELTRLAVFRLADVGYCPGRWACDNLRGFRIQAVDTEQNTLIDAVRIALQAPRSASASEPYWVASIHRFENLQSRERWDAILGMLEQLSQRARCMFVLHPVTESRLRKTGDWERLRANPRFELRPRMAYTQFVALLAGADFVVTDGGSNQEELSYLGVPTVLMRSATERQEGLGRNVLLSNYDSAKIREFLDSARRAPGAELSGPSPSARIVSHIVETYLRDGPN